MPCFSSISVNGVERTAIRWPISCQRFPVAKQKKRRKRGRRKKSVDRKKRRKKKNRWRIRQKIADTFSPRIIVDFSTRLRYKRAYNSRYSLTCMIDISTREIERERDRSRERNSQLRGGTITLKETGSYTKGGNYTEKREMDWHTYRESCWKKIIFETR